MLARTWKKPLIKKLTAAAVLAVALLTFANAAHAESGCHDRGSSGPVTIATR